MLEMARPSSLGPKMLGDELFKKFNTLLAEVNDRFKYGVHKYPELVDFKGEEAYGLHDKVLQERKLRYFFFCLNKNYKNLDYKEEITMDNERARSIGEMTQYCKQKGIHYSLGSIRMTTSAIFEKIKDDEKWFLSKNFQKILLDPKLMASYMNASRETFNQSSINAAAKREKEGGMGIRDLDKFRAEYRDVDKALSYKERGTGLKQKAAEKREKIETLRKKKEMANAKRKQTWANKKLNKKTQGI
jgi:hypothetical protein